MLRHVIMLMLCGTCVSIELLNLYEGSKCTRNDTSGVCVSIYRCLSSYLDLKNKEYAPICSFRGKEPIICCTDCSLVDDTRKMLINEQLGILYKTGRKAEDQCITYIHQHEYHCKFGRVHKMKRTYKSDRNCNEIDFNVGRFYASYLGADAFRAEYPHMAMLGYGDDITTADWLCAGSVISERFILTAGHCLSSPSLGPVKFVVLGTLKRADPKELWQKYNVKRIIPHPEYKPPSKYHDIALLETDKKIVFDKNVLPACLDTTGEAKDMLTATGWGALGHNRQLADILQALHVSRFEEEECLQQYPPHRHLQKGYNHTTQMCYGDKILPKDTCKGDSGGPLQFDNNDVEKCGYHIFGVTSFGRECGISAGSGIYTRVLHYVPWIESIVWP